MGAVLRLRDLRHHRGSREVLALEALDLAAGERLAVLGPNGAGKTTLLRLISGLESAGAGTVEVDGIGVDSAETARRRRVGYVTQHAALLSTSVRRNGTVRQLADPLTLIRRPADATVARLVGYDNVIQADADDQGRVLIGGVPCGVAAGGPGPAQLAVWAAALRVTAADNASLTATIERVSAGPGHWEVLLSGPAELRAQLPLDRTPPRPGARVGVDIDPSGVAVIGLAATACAAPSAPCGRTRSGPDAPRA